MSINLNLLADTLSSGHCGSHGMKALLYNGEKQISLSNWDGTLTNPLEVKPWNTNLITSHQLLQHIKTKLSALFYTK